MSDALPDPPSIEPGSLAGASFSRSRRGFEPTEVRSLLGRVADALRVWSTRDEQLSAEVASLRERVESAEHLDEAKVTELLGAETARIVAAARSAAAEIREHAEADATALRERTEAEVTARRDQLLSEAATEREAAVAERAAAEAAAAGALESAEREAGELRDASREAADALVAEATREAEERTAQAQAEATRTIEDATRRHDEMLAEAGGVLEARTSEAEAAAEEIRRTAAEELRLARDEAERIAREAEQAAEAMREQAREDARAMLEETRGLRHRMLRDLAERRRVARQQIEAARVARQGVIDAIRTAAVRLDDTIGELDEAEERAQQAADAAASAVPDDILTVAVQLEAELDGSDGALLEKDSPEAPAATPEPASAEGGEAGSREAGSPEAGSPEAGSPEGEGSEDSGAEPAADEAVEDGGTAGPDAGVPEAEAPGDAGDPEAATPPGGGSPADGEQLASVHDLFERLRSGADELDDDEPTGDQAAGETAPSGSSGPDRATPEAGAHPSAGPSGPSGGAEPPLVSVSAVAVATEVETLPAGDPDTALLDRRDEILASAERLLARSLKRLVGDEQNEVLDRARRIRKGRVELADLLAEDLTDRYVEALAEPYRLAAVAGAQMWCELTGDPQPVIDDDGVADSLRARVAELGELRRVQLRAALEELDESGEDLTVLVDRLRAAYREMRSVSVPHQAADLAISGFTAGTAAAAAGGGRWRWVPDNAGQPCADAEDNALAGAMPCGEAFPTGDVLPPAHPGCRCILVPAEPDA
jgi:cell division septum initiation protein DivIVA